MNRLIIIHPVFTGLIFAINNYLWCYSIPIILNNYILDKYNLLHSCIISLASLTILTFGLLMLMPVRYDKFTYTFFIITVINIFGMAYYITEKYI